VSEQIGRQDIWEAYKAVVEAAKRLVLYDTAGTLRALAAALEALEEVE
jgi:hypothetical protein